MICFYFPKKTISYIFKKKIKKYADDVFLDVKNVYKLLIPVLTYLVNLTFCERQFSTILKINKVMPIYKRSDSLLAEN